MTEWSNNERRTPNNMDSSGDNSPVGAPPPPQQNPSALWNYQQPPTAPQYNQPPPIYTQPQNPQRANAPMPPHQIGQPIPAGVAPYRGTLPPNQVPNTMMRPQLPQQKRQVRPFIIIIGVIVTICIVASAIFFFFSRNTMSKEEAYGTTFTADRYDLQDPMLNIANSHHFTMKVTQDAMERYSEDPTVDGCSFICVYGDATLDTPVPVSHHIDKDKETITVYGTDNPDASGESESLWNTNLGFSGYEHYWLVQWMDEHGKQLAKPKLTYFTVKDKYRSNLAKPEGLQLSIESDGILRIQWKPVEGAKKYRLYTISHNPALSEELSLPIVDTDKTSIRLDEFDYVNKCGGYEQEPCSTEIIEHNHNDALERLVEQSEDDVLACNQSSDDCHAYSNALMKDFYDEEHIDAMSREFNPDTDVTRGWIGVTAMDSDEHESYIATASLQPLARDLYIHEAYYINNLIDQQTKHGIDIERQPESIQQMDAQMYITMLDGRTKKVYRECTSEKTEYDYNVCTIPGTKYTDKASFSETYSLSTYQTNVAKWRSQEAKSSLVTGSLKEAVGKLNAVDSHPIGNNKVEQYKPFGSTEYTRYMAENLLAMHTSIDVTTYDQSPSAPEFSDVFNEVIMQNPYLQVMAKVDYSGIMASPVRTGNKTIIKVVYAQDAQKLRDEFYDTVKKAAATITAGATREGAIQIDQYLAANASYDYDAYHYSQTQLFATSDLQEKYPYAFTSGVLVKGKGVCSSYATSFDAIADQVGIPSWFVTGLGDSGPHAWNRVQIDGQWLDIDPTWDDDGTYASDTYQLKPANTLDKHITDSDWMLSMNVQSYGGAQR